jgi:pantetheine-phosphate adenylyltransferase
MRFFHLKNWMRESNNNPLHDSYGTTLTNGGLQALVVSKETENVAKEINRRRGEKGMKPLAIYVINMVNADDSIPISTTRIRRGEIDRDGHILESNVDTG